MRGVGTDAAYFRRRQVRILGSDDKGSPEAVVLREPIVDHIVVRGLAKRIRVIGIGERRCLDRLVAGQDRDIDAIFVEMLLLHDAIVVVFLDRVDVMAGEALGVKPCPMAVRESATRPRPFTADEHVLEQSLHIGFEDGGTAPIVVTVGIENEHMSLPAFRSSKHRLLAPSLLTADRSENIVLLRLSIEIADGTMNIPLLLTFLDVMETRNFKRSAERMNIMQSTVSARIRQMEEALGTRLFERGRGGAEPTPAGRRFVGHCHALLTLWGHARRDVVCGGSTSRRRLHVSCQYSLVRAYLVDWIDRLRSEDAELDLHVEINFSSQIQRDILSGETDVGIMFAPQLTPDIQIGDFGEAEFVMVSTDHRKLADVDIARYVKVAYTSAFQRALDDALPELAFPSMVIGSDDLAIELLARHGGTLYLPRFAISGAQSKVPNLQLVEDAPPILQPVFSAVHIRRRRDPLVVWALKLLKNVSQAR